MASVLEALSLSKQFGSMLALDKVTLKLRENTVHALLGENGAGKSTLVKCIMGYYQPDSGEIVVNDRQVEIKSPQQAALMGLGMVYQHFTLIPNMSIAENILLSRPNLPFIIDWKNEIKQLEIKMANMPFKFELNRKVSTLSAGEKQKVEIIKQLLLDSKILILDEPTSVLTPTEADEVLGKIHQLTREEKLTVLMITHKFREVTQYADEVTVLRKGKWIGNVLVADTNPTLLADMMVGGEILVSPPPKSQQAEFEPRLILKDLVVENDQGVNAICNFNLQVNKGEIVGIAGVSGNGQKQLMEALAGQRPIKAGTLSTQAGYYEPNQKNALEQGFFCLPEEPLRNACVGNLSLAENLILRRFNQPPFVYWNYFVNKSAMNKHALQLIKSYNVRTSGPDQEIQGLSGGNIQRVVLARELTQQINILVIANPCFGLDFKAVAEIRSQLLAARNSGAAILLLSEDLDEILELSDRFYVISSGQLVYETTPNHVDMNLVGQHMAGH
jgi:general nucleoside transport system ATP-binding protein